MSGSESDNPAGLVAGLMEKLEKRFGDRGGVACADLIDHTRLSRDPLVAELVFSMLLWESTIEHALAGVDRISEQLIDLNELRVCTADEISSLFPARSPKSRERAQRLIVVLNAIFEQQNRLSLAHLREMNKREVIDYFGAIDGLPPFASSRVILLGLSWHAFPIDGWLTKHLSREGITDPALDIVAQTQRMERLVRASDSLRFYTLVEHWAQSLHAAKGSRPARNGARPAKSPAKEPS